MEENKNKEEGVEEEMADGCDCSHCHHHCGSDEEENEEGDRE
ncbi:MAG: hypothetical protein NT165_02385 [Candidatus Falkowbacteria bacterium]|nr:hypothetical protein [Candidatus Falkowbacteria bacterium]